MSECVCVCMCVCVCPHARTCMHVYMHAYECVCMRACVCGGVGVASFTQDCSTLAKLYVKQGYAGEEP